MAFETTEELVEYCEGVISTNANSPADFRESIIAELDNAHKTILAGGGELNLDDGGQPIRRPQVFPWAKQINKLSLKVEAPITSKTASSTNGSKTVTLNSSYTPSLAGYYIKFLTNDVVYKIASHTGGSATLTLVEEFTEATTALESVEIFKLDYTFANVLVPLSKVMFRTANRINKQLDLLDKEAFEAAYPINCIRKQIPCKAGSILQDEAYNFTIRLDSYPEGISTISIDCIPVPTALSIDPAVNPLLPKHRRLVIAELTCYRFMKELDDDRADKYLQSAKRMFDALVTEGNQFKNKFDSKFARVNLQNLNITTERFRFMRNKKYD